MKLCVFFAIFVLGNAKYSREWYNNDDEDYAYGSGSGSFYFTTRDEPVIVDRITPEIQWTGAGDSDDKEKNNGGATTAADNEPQKSAFHCGHFNLEVCVSDSLVSNYHDAALFEDSLCLETYITTECLHNYVEACFPSVEVKEDYLSKMRGFQDNVQRSCKKKAEDNDKSEVEEAVKCLEGVEAETEECIESTVLKLASTLKAKNIQPDLIDMDALKCMMISETLECTMKGVQERCGEEVLEAFRKGAEEAVAKTLGVTCKDKIITDVSLE